MCFVPVLDKCLSAIAHVLTLATMACFVLFIEQTILVAGVSFIISVFSLAVALRDTTMMLLLWKVRVSKDIRFAMQETPADKA
jgi:hypothetical protein